MSSLQYPPRMQAPPPRLTQPLPPPPPPPATVAYQYPKNMVVQYRSPAPAIVKKMTYHGLSAQSWTVLVISILHIISLFVIMLYLDAFNGLSALSLAISIIFIAIYIFDTNCLTTGSCNIWSWVRTIFYLLTVALTLWLVIYVSVKIKKLNEELEEQEREREDERRRRDDDRRRQDDERRRQDD